VLSVPFELVNLEVIAYDMAACGSRFADSGYSSSQGTGDLIAWIHVSVPFDRSRCGVRHVVETWGVSNDVALKAEHAPPGPVAVLNQ
jgi:hypothetical protein